MDRNIDLMLNSEYTMKDSGTCSNDLTSRLNHLIEQKQKWRNINTKQPPSL